MTDTTRGYIAGLLTTGTAAAFTDHQQLLFGAILVYGIPLCAGILFWHLIAMLTHQWDARDVLTRFRPEPRHVAHTEKLLRVRHETPTRRVLSALVAAHRKGKDA